MTPHGACPRCGCAREECECSHDKYCFTDEEGAVRFDLSLFMADQANLDYYYRYMADRQPPSNQ